MTDKQGNPTPDKLISISDIETLFNAINQFTASVSACIELLAKVSGTLASQKEALITSGNAFAKTLKDEDAPSVEANRPTE